MQKKEFKINNKILIGIALIIICVVIIVELSIYNQFSNQIISQADDMLKNCVLSIDHNISTALKDDSIRFTNGRILFKTKFSDIALGSINNPDYWIIIYNPKEEVLVLNSETYPASYDIDTISSATCYQGAVETLISHSSHDEKHVQAMEYDYSGSRTPQRLAFINAGASENGMYSIGIAVDYSNVIIPIRNSGFKLIVCGAVIVVCIILLAIGFVSNVAKAEKASKEIGELEKITEAMQEVIDTSEQLMHIQRLETIGTLTAGVAHEFNNLLTPIMGYSLMALEQIPEDNTELYDEMIQIYESSKRAKDIVSRLSALSRKNTPKNYVMVSPDALIAQVKSVAKASAKENIEIEERLNCPDKILSCNETQIAQVMLNLMINAFQAMEKGGGKLLIESSVTGKEISIKFTDNGPGISNENAAKIFEPFFTTKESGKGTGLGLPICRHIAEEHGGSLSLVQSNGTGACFELRLPVHS